MKQVFWFLFFLICPFFIYGQSASDVEQTSRAVDAFQNKEKDFEKKIIRERTEKKSVDIERPGFSAGKNQKNFFIRTIELEGCENFSPQEFSSLVLPYENRSLNLELLEALADEIEQAYLKKGIISAVFVPPQDIKNETVVLKVIEAKMGALNIEDSFFYNKQILKKYWQVAEGDTLRYELISRSLQIMNRNPDRKVRATLNAGKKPGTTDVVLTQQTELPSHYTASFDNEGVTSTGHGRSGLGMRHNNLFGLDDMFFAGHNFGKEFSGTYVYHSVPLGYKGTSLMYGYSTSKARPKKEFTEYGIRSDSDNFSCSLRRDLFQADRYLGEVYLGFEAKDKSTVLNTGTLNRDRLRVFSLGGQLVKNGLGSVTYIYPKVSQGIHGLGSSGSGNPYASRKAKPVFTKAFLGLEHKRRLAEDIQGDIKLNSQIASTTLTPQEAFRMGGIDSVRGYPSGDYLADSGVIVSGELLLPLFFVPEKVKAPFSSVPLRQNTTLVGFCDYGWGQRRSVADTEKHSVNFFGLGLGLRLRCGDKGLIRMEWGFPLGDDPLTEDSHSRFHFSFDFQGNFPQTVARFFRKQVKDIDESNEPD